MFNLKEAIKARIGVYNHDLLAQANSKCLTARELVQKSSETNNAGLMFQAVEIYIEAIKIYPRLIEPYLSVAYICWKFKKLDNAIMLLNKAIELEPFNNSASTMLGKITKEQKTSNFSKLKEKYRSEEIPLNEKIIEKANPKKGLIAKIFDLFSFKPKRIIKTEAPSVLPKKKDDFGESLAELSMMMSYEKVKVMVDRKTLSRIADAMAEKDLTPHTTIKSTGERVASMSGLNREKIEQMSHQNKELLQEKRDNLSKEQLVVRVNRNTFSKITRKL